MKVTDPHYRRRREEIRNILRNCALQMVDAKGRQIACLSIEDAAAYLGISVSWLYKASAKAQIPCVKIGARKVFLIRDLDEYLTRHRREAINSPFETKDRP